MWVSKKEKNEIEKRIQKLEEGLLNCKKKAEYLEWIIKDSQLLCDITSDWEKISSLINEFLEN